MAEKGPTGAASARERVILPYENGRGGTGTPV